MQFTGRITHALEQRSGTSQKTGTPWTVQEFRIEEENNRFNQSVAFSVFGEGNLRNFNLQVGRLYSVELDFNTREFDGRFYNKVTCYNATPLDSATTPAPSQALSSPPPAPGQVGRVLAPASSPSEPPSSPSLFSQDDTSSHSDDLPF